MTTMPRPFLCRPLTVFLRALWSSSRGATAVEYGLIVAVIALTATGAMSALGSPVSGVFASIRSDLLSAR